FNPGTNIGSQQVPSANFALGGNLVLQIAGYGAAGVNYDQLNVTGPLVLGGSSVLTLDLAGLSVTGTASGVVQFGSRGGTTPLFSQVSVINNPNNFGVQLTYNANSIDVTIVPGGAVTSGVESNTLARGASDAINVDEVINNFRAPTSGTYYVSVTGAPGTTYNLVVTRNADFDTEQNDSFARAQNLDGAKGVLGYAAPSGLGRVFTFDNTAIQIRELDPTTGLILHS